MQYCICKEWEIEKKLEEAKEMFGKIELGKKEIVCGDTVKLTIRILK